MKHQVPAAPLPSFADKPAVQQQAAAKSGVSVTGRANQVAPLDTRFLHRTMVTTVWFGALLAIVVYCATRSTQIAASFEAGTLLAALLLGSQLWFVGRFTASRTGGSYRGWDARFPLWVLVPVKYLGVAALIGLSLKYRLLNPAGFAAGFTVLQIVIFARVAGRLLKARMRPIDQVYIRHANR